MAPKAPKKVFKLKLKKPRKKDWNSTIKKLGTLKQINFDAAGIDVGNKEIFVAVPEDRDEVFVRKFGTFTIDLHAVVSWLKACNVSTVALEATGVYWVTLYEVLDNAGIDVYLVDARKTKNVSGKKTDVTDCQWIQQLHTYGLLSRAFVPSESIRRLRDLIRHRDMLVRYRSSHIQHMQKALELMNVKLTSVLTDITGCTGIQIIRAIVQGERDPHQLAQYRDIRCRKSEAEIAKALTGHFKEEQIFVLQQSLELYDYYTCQMKKLDAKVEACYMKFSKEAKVEANEKTLKKLSKSKVCRDKNAPDYDLRTYLFKLCGVDLVQVNGLNILNVQEIISEIGVDMSRWKSMKHFTNWLSLCPNNKISGGKKLQGKTQKTSNRATKAFRMAALGLARSETPLGRFYRKIRAKAGGPQAITATAHKLARIVYVMLSKQVEYCEEKLIHHEKKNKGKMLRNLMKRAANLGYELVEKENEKVA